MTTDPKEIAEPEQDLAPDDELTPVVLNIPTDVVDEAPTEEAQKSEEIMTEPTFDEPNEAPVYSEHPITPVPFPEAEELLLLMPFNKRPRKKILKPLLIILAILLAIGLILYMVFFVVIKSDYQAAANDVSTVRDKYSIVTDISLSADPNAIATAKSAYVDFKAENEKLAGLKAFRYDKALKAQFDAYEAKAKADIAYEDTFLPSFARFADANAQIDSLGTGGDAFTAANIQTTINIYKSINDVTNPAFNTYVTSAIDLYQAMLPQAQVYESNTVTSAQKQAALSGIKASALKLSDSAAKLSDDLDAKSTTLRLNDSLTDLMNAVSAKLK